MEAGWLSDEAFDLIQRWVSAGEMSLSVYEGPGPRALTLRVLGVAKRLLGGALWNDDYSRTHSPGEVLGLELKKAGWSVLAFDPRVDNGLPLTLKSPGAGDAVTFVDADREAARVHTAAELQRLPPSSLFAVPTKFSRVDIHFEQERTRITDPAVQRVARPVIHVLGMAAPLYEGTLEEYAREPRPRAGMVACIKGAALALHYLHANGFVHGRVFATEFLYHRTPGGHVKVVMCGLGAAMHLRVGEDARPARFRFPESRAIYQSAPLEAALDVPARYASRSSVVDVAGLQAQDVFGLGATAAVLLAPAFRAAVDAAGRNPRYREDPEMIGLLVHLEIYGYPRAPAVDALRARVEAGLAAYGPGTAGRFAYGLAHRRLYMLTTYTGRGVRADVLDWAGGGARDLPPCVRDALSSVVSRRPSAAEFATRVVAEETARQPARFVHLPRDDDTTTTNTLAPS